MNGTAPATVEITSFGYLHGPSPEGAHVVLDLRRHFRDPHVSPDLRHLTARDAAVRHAVTRTPGIPELLDSAAGVVLAYLAGPGVEPVAVAVGCAGGRHRAAVVAEELAAVIERQCVSVAVTHRDLHRPVVERGGIGGAA